MLPEIIIEGVDDGPICHYVSFSKLLRLVIDSAIFFPKLQCYQRLDPYECNLWPMARYSNEPLAHLQQWAITLASFHGVPSNSSIDDRVTTLQRLRKEIGQADTASVLELLKILEIREWADGVICNCWHLNAEESDAMWKVYSSHGGAVIFSTVKQLADGIGGYVIGDDYEKNTPWVLAPVAYRNEDELSELTEFYVKRPWLLKRRAFEHEKELRIFKALPGGSRRGSGQHVRINTPAVVNKILLSPFNSQWENRTLEIVLKELWAKRFSTSPLIQASRHLTATPLVGSILANVEQIKEREENMTVMKALSRLPLQLLLRGRTDYSTDEHWIVHVVQSLSKIWDQVPTGIIQVVILDEIIEILKFTRNVAVATEARGKLNAIRVSIFKNDPEGEKVSSEALAEVARFLQDKLKV